VERRVHLCRDEQRAAALHWRLGGERSSTLLPRRRAPPCTTGGCGSHHGLLPPHHFRAHALHALQIDQLFRIFERLGTPTSTVWPSLSTLPDWCDKFPKFRGQSWGAVAPRLCEQGRDLLARMLTFDPTKRISAADALAHPYFTASGGVTYPLPMLAGGPARQPQQQPPAPSDTR